MLTERARITLPITILAGLLAATASGAGAILSARNQILTEVRAAIREAVQEERDARAGELKRYVTREELQALGQRIEARLIRLEVMLEKRGR